MAEEAPRASGQCHCGEIRYSMSTAVQHHALCHCSDCRRHSGAPLVGWALVGNDELEISGTAQISAYSEHGPRHFLANCGTGLYIGRASWKDRGCQYVEHSVGAVSSKKNPNQ